MSSFDEEFDNMYLRIMGPIDISDDDFFDLIDEANDNEEIPTHKYLVKIYYSLLRGDELAIWFFVKDFSDVLGFYPLHSAIPLDPIYRPIMKELLRFSEKPSSSWERKISDMLELAEELILEGNIDEDREYTWTKDCI